MQSVQIAENVKQYIAAEFLDGDDQDLDTGSPLLEWGILDSVGMVKLVSYLEGSFKIRIPQSDITPSNFRDVARISSMVVTLSSRPPPAMPEGQGKVDVELAELIEFGAKVATTGLDSGASFHSVEVDGEGPTWLLLPEPGESATYYADVQRALEGDFRSLAIDLLGFGMSSGPNREPTFWDHVGLLAEFIRQDRGGQYVVVGHGLSSAIALELARRAPEQVRAVISLAFGDVDPSALLTSGNDAKAYLEPRRREASAVTSCQLEGAAQRVSAPAYRSFLNDDAAQIIPTLFQVAVTPTLFLGALEDGLVPSSAVESAAASTPGSELKWLARAGHGFPRERADEAVSMMKNYVNGLS